MRRDRNRLLTGFAVLVYVFLFTPIAILIVFSFNVSKRNFIWRGFTLDWYPALFNNRDLLDALGRTLQVAAVAVLASTILGTLLGLGLARIALTRPRDGRDAAPAADGHARDRHGDQPAALLRSAVRRAGVARADHDRPHHLLHLVRRGGRPGARGRPRPAARGGRSGPRAPRPGARSGTSPCRCWRRRSRPGRCSPSPCRSTTS